MPLWSPCVNMVYKRTSHKERWGYNIISRTLRLTCSSRYHSLFSASKQDAILSLQPDWLDKLAAGVWTVGPFFFFFFSFVTSSNRSFARSPPGADIIGSGPRTLPAFWVAGTMGPRQWFCCCCSVIGMVWWMLGPACAISPCVVKWHSYSLYTGTHILTLPLDLIYHIELCLPWLVTGSH